MRAITRTLIENAAVPPGPVLELGCGGAQTLTQLPGVWLSQPRLGLDLDGQTLSYTATSGRDSVTLVQAELQHTPLPDYRFALCLALDAFDQHGVKLEHALAESHRLLQPGGLLVMRVSANPCLTGPHDAAFNTGRRYTRTEVEQSLGDAGYDLLRITYANTVLSAPVAFLRLLQRWTLAPLLPSLYTSPSLNRTLEAALHLEARWLQSINLPFGLSIYVLARKS